MKFWKNWLAALAVIVLTTAASPAFAALGAQTTWEVRPTVGSNTNGGAFRFGIGGTDVSGSATLVVDSANDKKVTSSAHTFVSGDVGKYMRVTAGTGWRLGWYQVKSIEGSGAILDRSPAATSVTGGTYSLYSAIDYSQQDTANSSGSNISTTDAVANGTTTITSATGAFTSALPGNVIYLTGGTGSLTGGWYEVASVTNSTTIVVDRTVATGTGITMNIGGALASLSVPVANAVNSNQVFVKNTGTLTTSTGFAFTQSTFTLRGYDTVRGDAGRATIQATAGSIDVVSFSGGYQIRNFVIDCNSQTSTQGIVSTSSGGVINNIVEECTTRGIYLRAGNNGTNIVLGNEVRNLVFGATQNIEITSTTGTNYTAIYNNYIHDSYGDGIRAVGGMGLAAIVNNVIDNLQGAGADGIETAQGLTLNNTIYDVEGYGINLSMGSGTTAIQNNIIMNADAGGINYSSNVRLSSMMDGNAYYLTSGQVYNGQNPNSEAYASAMYAPQRDIILTFDPFVNAAGGDFSLNSTGGGGGALRGTGYPLNYTGYSGTNNLDFGAIQSQGAGGAGGSFVFGQ